MRFPTDRLKRLERSLELALNQEWPQLSATRKCLVRFHPKPITLGPGDASPMSILATVATDSGENRRSLEPIQL
jgi:hypothetical protein